MVSVNPDGQITFGIVTPAAEHPDKRYPSPAPYRSPAEDEIDLIARLEELALARSHIHVRKGEEPSYTFGKVSTATDAARPWFSVVAEPRRRQSAQLFTITSNAPLPGQPGAANRVVIDSVISDAVRRLFVDFLDWIENPQPYIVAVDLRLTLEEFAAAWRENADRLELSPDDRRTGDAFAEMFGRLSTTDDPPSGVVREGARWFTRVLSSISSSRFGQSMADSAGAAAGRLAVYGPAAVLLTHVDKIARLVGA